MRWLLQELAASGGRNAIGAGKHAAAAAHHTVGGASGIMTSVSHAAGWASEAASDMASNVNSELAANVVSRSRSAASSLDSATALPGAYSGSSGAAQALDLHTDGKEHLNPPHSVWHGHGRVLLLLVAVHLAAFLYWIYLYVIGRKSEARKTEQARRVVKPFKVVYEWGLDTATALTAAVYKKQAVSPGVTPRIAMTMQSPVKTPSMGGLQRSNSGFSLNKLIKGRAL